MASGARFRVLAVCVFGLLLATALPRTADARIDVDFNVFVGALSPHGTWFDYPSYGRVWRPAHVGHGWRPYTDGRWVWSDRHGWVWDEDEDWGWATYHYGRWLFDNRVGWFWIPGYEWAPAWVSWRYGPSYVGWVPMGPRGFSIASYPHSRWSFVSHRHFFRPQLHRYAFVPDRRVFRECRDEIRMDQRDGRWFNRGADRHYFERASAERTPVVRVRDVDRPQRAEFRGDRDRDGARELRMFRPNVREASKETGDDSRRAAVDRFERPRSDRVDGGRGRAEERGQPRARERNAIDDIPRADGDRASPRAPERERGWRDRSSRDRREARQLPQQPPPARLEAPRNRRPEGERPAQVSPTPRVRDFGRPDRADHRARGERMRRQEQPQQIARPQAAPAPSPRASEPRPSKGGRTANEQAGRGTDRGSPGSWRERR